VYRHLEKKNGGKPSFLTVIAHTLKLIEGTFGCLFKSSLYPNEVVACRLSSPLLLGLKYQDEPMAEHVARSIDVDEDSRDFSDPSLVHSAQKPCEFFVASDATAFADATNRTVILEDWDLVHVSANGVDIINVSPKGAYPPSRIVETLNISIEDIARGAYPHFMLKEIMEQPSSISLTIRGRLTPNDKSIHMGMSRFVETVRQARTIMFIACGTSYNAALAVRPLFEKYTRQRVFVEVSSDFNDRKPVVFRDDCCIFVSQSGETADTLVSLAYCKHAGAFCVGINNTPGSSISRQTHCGIHLNAGVEIGVASTKAYTSSIVCLLLLLLAMIEDSRQYETARAEAIQSLLKLPEYVKQALDLRGKIEELAGVVAEQKSLLLLGRKTNYATARETALKVKELSYIHSDGLMAGELKHAQLALVDERSFVIFFATGEDGEVFRSCLDGLQQIKARGATVMVVATDEEREQVRTASDYLIVVPKVAEWIQMIVNIVPMQLLSYYVATKKGLNVDRPRNLAKSVTVV
jgi:glucosamine--fructose-6-phosphate aminotransferase (isomerizing)